MNNRFISDDSDLTVKKPDTDMPSQDNDNAADDKELDEVLKEMNLDKSDSPVMSSTDLKLNILAKSKEKEHKRNAIPKEEGGRKETPEKPSNPKMKLLKELHESESVQKILKKHPKLDIIVVEKKD